MLIKPPSAASHRAWVRLPSGRHLDLINPAPHAWTDADMAVCISRTYRWGGQSKWPLPLSVGQHSLMVLALRRQLEGRPLTPEEELLELGHDLDEAFLGFDCISPLKAVLGDPFKQVSDRLYDAIAARYGFPKWTPESHAIHKQADCIAAASEAVHCVGWTEKEVREVLLISHPILSVDPLARIYGCPPWEPWPAQVAAERFLAELRRILDKAAQEALAG